MSVQEKWKRVPVEVTGSFLAGFRLRQGNNLKTHRKYWPSQIVVVEGQFTAILEQLWILV